jgi:drug/metabolite transporter (DMT)-like permease
MPNLLAFILSLGTAVLGTVIYHLAQKQIPASANPALVLIGAYAIGGLLSALAIPVLFPLRGAETRALAGIGWPVVALGLAVVLIEFGFLWMYRSGWGISTGGLSVNVVATVALLMVGVWVFREQLSLLNWLGVGVCLVGLALMAHRG